MIRAFCDHRNQVIVPTEQGWEDGYGTDISDDIIMHLLESLKKGEGETHYFSCSIGFGFLNVRIDNETYEYSNGKSVNGRIRVP